MKINIKKLLLTFALVIPAFMQVALPDPPGPPGPGGPPGGGGGVPVGSPIDEGTIVLMVIAFAYGVYKIIEFRRNRASETSMDS